MSDSVIDPGTGNYVDVPEMAQIEGQESMSAGISDEEAKQPKVVRKKTITRAKVILATMFLLLILTIAYFINKSLDKLIELRQTASTQSAPTVFSNAEPVPTANAPIVSDYNVIPVQKIPDLVGPGGSYAGVNSAGCPANSTYPCLR